MTQRNTEQALKWYASHTSSSALGYNPNGMCLKICRQARNIGPMYPSALAAQTSTPKTKRVTELNKILPGMVMYFDVPRDSNPYGHIVTVHSRSKIVSSLDDLVVWSNSVKSGSVVKVRASHFPKAWGDKFQFGATWLNGEDLLLGDAPKPSPSPERKPLSGGRGPRLRHAIQDLDKMAEYRESVGDSRLAAALRRDRDSLRRTLGEFE